jgi:hypothetical protein
MKNDILVSMKTHRALCVIIAVAIIFTGYTTPALAKTKKVTVTKHPVAIQKPVIVIPDQAAVEAKVRDYFKDAPDMIEIARCESKFRQYTDSGNVFRGGMSGGMVGVFQFFESIHAPGAKALGLDLTTLDGNLAYAKHVYETEGTTPWNSSQDCWDTKPLLGAATTTLIVSDSTSQAKLLEQIATLTKLIALLQKQLNAQKTLALK